MLNRNKCDTGGLSMLQNSLHVVAATSKRAVPCHTQLVRHAPKFKCCGLVMHASKATLHQVVGKVWGTSYLPGMQFGLPQNLHFLSPISSTHSLLNFDVKTGP